MAVANSDMKNPIGPRERVDVVSMLMDEWRCSEAMAVSMWGLN